MTISKISDLQSPNIRIGPSQIQNVSAQKVLEQSDDTTDKIDPQASSIQISDAAALRLSNLDEKGDTNNLEKIDDMDSAEQRAVQTSAAIVEDPMTSVLTQANQDPTVAMKLLE